MSARKIINKPETPMIRAQCDYCKMFAWVIPDRPNDKTFEISRDCSACGIGRLKWPRPFDPEWWSKCPFNMASVRSRTGRPRGMGRRSK